MNDTFEITDSDVRQLLMAQAIGFTKAAIRRAVHLNDDSYLRKALEHLEAV